MLKVEPKKQFDIVHFLEPIKHRSFSSKVWYAIFNWFHIVILEFVGHPFGAHYSG